MKIGKAEILDLVIVLDGNIQLNETVDLGAISLKCEDREYI
jgi:hypothetical protein